MLTSLNTLYIHCHKNRFDLIQTK